MDAHLNDLISFARVAAFRIGTAVGIALVFWLVAIVVGRLIVRIESHVSSRRDLLVLVGRSVKLIIITFGLLTALGTAGINVSALVAGLGLTGFALGFALRDVLSNVLSGFLILFYRPFALGDRINVTGLEGKVIEVDLRYTSLDAGDKLVLIPNSNLFTNPIVVLRGDAT